MTDQPIPSAPSTRLALPSVLARDPVMRQFAEAVGRLLSPFHTALADFPRLLDPWRTDPGWLRWLAQVCDAPELSQWGEPAQRAAIESATALTAERGTLNALRHQASLVGWELSVSDPGWVKTAAELPSEAEDHPREGLAVALAWPPSETLDQHAARSLLQSMAQANCPATVPLNIFLGEGYTPTAGLTLPAAFQAHSGGARTVFFYSPGSSAIDPTVGYDLTARRPVPGPSRLDQRWKGLDTTGLTDFVKDAIDAAAYVAEKNCFLLVAGQKVAHWDGTGQRFTRVYDLNTVFPGLGSTTVDDILSVTSGNKKGLYVFSGDTYQHYPSPFTATGKSSHKIKDLYTGELPAEFQRDLDAVVEDPDQDGVHYLLAGPRCAEIHGFAYRATHFIRDLWPGLPVRTSSAQTGGGALGVSELVTTGQPLTVSYYTRGRSSGAQISLYAASKVPFDDRKSLGAPVASRPATESSGSVTIPGTGIQTPGVHTLYYGDPAFGTWLADPAEFTAILPENIRKQGKITLPQAPESGSPITFTWEGIPKAWQQGAAVVVYRGKGPQTQTPSEQAPAAGPLALLTRVAGPSGLAIAPEPGLPPGEWTAFLVARGHSAWLADPALFTVTLAPLDYGTLTLTNGSQGSLPAGIDPVFTVAHSVPVGRQRADGRLRIYPGQDIPQANQLPARDAAWTASVSASSSHYEAKTTGLVPGGYTAYWTAGASPAWLAPPLLFNVEIDPDKPGTLSIKPDQGNTTDITYSVPYSFTGKNIITVFECINGIAEKPVINTGKGTWGAKAILDAPSQHGSTTLNPASFKENLWAPGDYRIHFTGSGGGKLAEPQIYYATLTTPPPKGIQLDTAPDLITDQSDIKVKFSTKYQHEKNYYTTRVGDKQPAGLEIEKANQKGDEQSVTLSKKYLPGKYTIYFFARSSEKVQLAEPATFLVHAAKTTADSVEIVTKSLTFGDPIKINYSTRFGGNTTPGYNSSNNKIKICAQNEEEFKSQAATKKTDTVEFPGDLPPGSYTVHLTGKDGSQLAAPVRFNVAQRTMTFKITDATNDVWDVRHSPVDCTGTTPPGTIPATTGNPNPAIITYTQGNANAAMSGSMTFTAKDTGPETITVRWAMQQNGSVAYSTQGAATLAAEFSPNGTSSWATSSTPASGAPGGGPHAEMHVRLSNQRHRSVSVTYQNFLPWTLARQSAPPPTNAEPSGTLPDQVPQNATSTPCTYTVISSAAPASGTATYQFTQPGQQNQQLVTLSWTSPPYPGRPIYRITPPTGATVQTTGLTILIEEGTYNITNVQHTKVIDLAGTSIIGYDSNGGDNQKWYIARTAGDDILYTIKCRRGSFYLGLDATNGTVAQSAPANWRIESLGNNNAYRIFNAKGTLTLSSPNNETKLTLAPWEENNNQKWKLQKSS
ncbi:RICIN domain-containing protein [Streptomyces formicae]|uniref:RICIN domain-containing protein n=1 Tax=Streptomyces formicae TaxID=1616117 RepID=A0ABY3WP16_9ACTN|nr:RICIN domain-containing protein [Streptomyces formicae]UNM13209.1 RICIN domain-containing protein [Streptomyces formicae]